MNLQELKKKLSLPFDLNTWKGILSELFSNVVYYTSEASVDANLIKRGGQIGEIKLDDGHSLAVFDFEVADKIDISRNRKGLRDIAARYVDQERNHGAWVFYHSNSKSDYRLTYVSKQTYFSNDGELIVNETAPKRYTFLLGPNEPCTTAAYRLNELQEHKDGSLELKHITAAFSVERLNKEFFKEYKQQYGIFLSELGEDKKENRDYVKKLLGRLVFIQFLQKKGWMGVPITSQGWKDGDKNYFLNLVERYQGNDRLLSDVLEYLFFDTLNRRRENDLADERLGSGIKIPYLNGGLFDKDSVDKLDVDFPYVLFKGLADFFSKYNFTIDENDPDDSEVGIDPEMLGHIFENLLEDNKDKGAFYTPKEIVQYMCENSIGQYLKTHLGDSFEPSIYKLLRAKFVDEIVKDNAKQIYELLCKVRVCDPAIGSGAFPMGILNVLFQTRQLLYPYAKYKESFSLAGIKRDIIQNNIFGVDIEQGAVDIARLRFWLALVVDEEVPQPLPNLDYKIMCGNSQLCRYALKTPISEVFKEYNKAGRAEARRRKTEWEDFTLESYKQLVTDYLEAHDNKSALREKIDEIKRCFKVTLANGDIYELQKAEAEVEDYEFVTIFGHSRKDDDPTGYEKAKQNLQKQREKVSEILNNQFYKDSFEWRFEYPQLLDGKGDFIGFDIIIANPPYLKEGRISKTFFEPYKSSPYYKGKMDIWYLFACNGLDLLNKDGILCFIATNNWVTSFGASKLRDKVMKETRICNLVDFGAVMMFESASIQTMIMMFQKDSISDDYSFDYRRLNMFKATEKEAIAALYNYENLLGLETFRPIVRRSSYEGKNFTFSRNGAVLDAIAQNPSVIYLRADEVAQGIVFPQDFLNAKNQRLLGDGYIAGEGVFVLTNDDLVRLELDSTEMEIMRPYYTTEQISRYYSNKQNDLWVIYTGSDFKSPERMRDYPRLKKHIDRFLSILTSDNRPYGLHRAREERFFSRPKVVALRKSVERPAFAYCDFDCYLSQTFNMIQTSRVDMRYLTGLLNSKLAAYWFKSKGKMQGANYQLDKEPLQQFPIAVPSNDTQDIIAKLVDMIILLNTTDRRASELVQNSYVSSEIERLIDGCIYEIYLPGEMAGLSITTVLRNYIKPKDTICINDIWELYMKIDSTGIIESLNSLSLSDSEALRTIILS